MSEDWEEWEIDDLVIPTLNKTNSEQQRIIEERKLVEESDNALTRELFDNNLQVNKTVVEIKTTVHVTDTKTSVVTNQRKIHKINNREKNEQRQKEMSKLLKELKYKKEREIEIFGDSEYYDEYTEYEDKFA